MAEFDSNVADISAILDAYMYLNYQYNPEESQEKNINQILEDIESLHEDNEYYKVLKKACEENPSLGEYTLVSQSHYDHETNGQDFFNYEPSQWDILVSNPPFSRKVEVFERCLKLGKPFALLMSNYWLNNVAPCRLFQNTDLELLMFDKRIQFGKGKNVPFNSSYFCHKILPKQIIFEQIDVTDKSPSCMQDDIPDKANINSQENKAIINFQL